MNAHKGILLLGLITLGVIVGGSLSLLSNGGTLVTGVAFGGLLGVLLYCLIQTIISRRKRENSPYDRLDERHPTHHETHQTYEAKFRTIQDNVMDDIMHFPPPKQ